MTSDELNSIINESQCCYLLAQPGVDAGFVQFASLGPWAGESLGDEGLEWIADRMDWLPSSPDQDDPVHGRSLEELAERSGRSAEISRRCLDIHRATLSSLAGFRGNAALKVGPHDFTGAARGSVLYAARRAALEILVEKSGFWCHLMHVYRAGHWPCGLLPNGRVVVM